MVMRTGTPLPQGQHGIHKKCLSISGCKGPTAVMALPAPPAVNPDQAMRRVVINMQTSNCGSMQTFKLPGEAETQLIEGADVIETPDPKHAEPPSVTPEKARRAGVSRWVSDSSTLLQVALAPDVTPTMQADMRSTRTKLMKPGRKSKKKGKAGCSKRRTLLKKLASASSFPRASDEPGKSSEAFEVEEDLQALDPASSSGDAAPGLMGSKPEDEADPGCKSKPKARAKPKAKAKAKATAKAKAKAKETPKKAAKPKGKATSKAKAKSKACKRKAAAKAKSKASKNSATPEPAHDSEREPRKSRAPSLGDDFKQRRIEMPGGRWVFEILEGQELGCAGCRYIYNGCEGCRKDSFKGRNATKMWWSPPYQAALAAIEGDCAQPAMPEDEEPMKRRRSKGKP